MCQRASSGGDILSLLDVTDSEYGMRSEHKNELL